MALPKRPPDSSKFLRDTVPVVFRHEPLDHKGPIHWNHVQYWATIAHRLGTGALVQEIPDALRGPSLHTLVQTGIAPTTASRWSVPDCLGRKQDRRQNVARGDHQYLEYAEDCQKKDVQSGYALVAPAQASLVHQMGRWTVDQALERAEPKDAEQIRALLDKYADLFGAAKATLLVPADVGALAANGWHVGLVGALSLAHRYLGFGHEVAQQASGFGFASVDAGADEVERLVQQLVALLVADTVDADAWWRRLSAAAPVDEATEAHTVVVGSGVGPVWLDDEEADRFRTGLPDVCVFKARQRLPASRAARGDDDVKSSILALPPHVAAARLLLGVLCAPSLRRVVADRLDAPTAGPPPTSHAALLGVLGVLGCQRAREHVHRACAADDDKPPSKRKRSVSLERTNVVPGKRMRGLHNCIVGLDAASLEHRVHADAPAALDPSRSASLLTSVVHTATEALYLQLGRRALADLQLDDATVRTTTAKALRDNHAPVVDEPVRCVRARVSKLDQLFQGLKRSVAVSDERVAVFEHNRPLLATLDDFALQSDDLACWGDVRCVASRPLANEALRMAWTRHRAWLDVAHEAHVAQARQVRDQRLLHLRLIGADYEEVEQLRRQPLGHKAPMPQVLGESLPAWKALCTRLDERLPENGDALVF